MLANKKPATFLRGIWQLWDSRGCWQTLLSSQTDTAQGACTASRAVVWVPYRASGRGIGGEDGWWRQWHQDKLRNNKNWPFICKEMGSGHALSVPRRNPRGMNTSPEILGSSSSCEFWDESVFRAWDTIPRSSASQFPGVSPYAGSDPSLSEFLSCFQQWPVRKSPASVEKYLWDLELHREIFSFLGHSTDIAQVLFYSTLHLNLAVFVPCHS